MPFFWGVQAISTGFSDKYCHRTCHLTSTQNVRSFFIWNSIRGEFAAIFSLSQLFSQVCYFTGRFVPGCVVHDVNVDSHADFLLTSQRLDNCWNTNSWTQFYHCIQHNTALVFIGLVKPIVFLKRLIRNEFYHCCVMLFFFLQLGQVDLFMDPSEAGGRGFPTK